jgi:hypothetical protein
MSQNVIQSSFAAGELSPTLYARVDLTKYHIGAATMRNWFVDYRSGSSTRSGTKFVIQAFNSAKPVRVIPFQTSVLVPYILEFGDFYVRPSSNGNPVLETPFNVTSITQANPGVITAPGNNLNVGDWFFVSGVGGMIQLDSRYFTVIAVGVGTVTIGDLNGNPISTLAYTAFTSGGTIARVFKFASPFAAADLQLVKFVQVANVMYMVHPSYAPQTLTFNTPTSWTFAPIVFGTTVTAPGTPTVTGSTTGVANYAYVVTAVDSLGQESSPSPAGVLANAVNIGATAGTITITWTAVPGAASYNVYKAELSISSAVPSGAAFGFIGFCTGTTFVDSNIVPDFVTTPPIAMNPFAAGNNPGCVCFFQQRLYYAGSNQFPQTFWASQPGFYNNFNVSDPVQATDAITGTLVSLQVNFIKSMVPMPGGLILLTANGAWQLSSGSGLASTSAVTPINATATPQAYNGVSDVPPIIAVQDVLYVQSKGAIVRDLTYNIYANIYTGMDISILSNHLFFNYQITQWAWAEEPFKIVWAVRSDGKLLGLTYIKDQEMMGWTIHDTLGLFTSIATVTETNTNAIYLVAKRFIGGQWVQIVERLADRVFTYGAEDSWSVDCGTMSAQVFPAANLTANVSTGTATFIADQNVFSGASVGQILRMGGGIATITTFQTPTQVMGNITQPITTTLPNDPTLTPVPAASGTWSIMPQFTTFLGLDYLNGQTVSILADGNVITPQVVTNGSITLAQPASKVVVGLKYLPQLQTMYLDLGQEGDTIQGKRKKINALTVRVNQTRGLSFGQTFSNLSPIKEFSQNLVLGQAIPLQSTDERVIMDPLWDVPGQICLQQDNPLPATVLGVVPEITLGDTNPR